MDKIRIITHRYAYMGLEYSTVVEVEGHYDDNFLFTHNGKKWKLKDHQGDFEFMGEDGEIKMHSGASLSFTQSDGYVVSSFPTKHGAGVALSSLQDDLSEGVNQAYPLPDNTTPAMIDGCTSPQYTGGSSDYYKVFVKNPTTLEDPYEAECNDIIEALNMTFAEGNAFKAIWRKAKARQGVKKKGYDNGVYDSEKVVFFGERMLIEAKDNESV